MEDQKQRKPLTLKFKIRRVGGFQIEKSQSQEITEKKTMGFLSQLQNQVPSSSIEEENKIERDYSSSNIDSNSKCSTSTSSEILNSRLPNWLRRGKRSRKSLISSSKSLFSSLSSTEKQKEPSLCEKEVADALLMLAGGFSLDRLMNKDRRITDFPDMNKKRKLADTNLVDYAEHDSKKLRRIEKETTRVYRDGFMLDTMKKILILSSGNFRGGHKSKCKINGKFAQFARKRNSKNHHQMDGSLRLHECKLCSMKFSTGQALGGHQRRHRTEPLIISRSSSVSPSDGVKKNKMTLFDLNEHPLEKEENELFELRLSPRSILDF